MSAKHTTQRLSRRERKALTREKLKRAALESFEEHGFAAAQIADVARRAGVASGTFYVHFESKDALLEDLLKAFNTELMTRIQTAWMGSQASDLEGRVRVIATTCLEHWSENRVLCGAFAERAFAGSTVHELRDGISPPAGHFLRQGIETFATSLGLELLVPAELIVQGILGLWLRVGLHFLFGEQERAATTLEEAREALVRLTLGALQGAIPGIT